MNVDIFTAFYRFDWERQVMWTVDTLCDTGCDNWIILIFKVGRMEII